jgi:hypothetical protein
MFGVAGPSGIKTQLGAATTGSATGLGETSAEGYKDTFGMVIWQNKTYVVAMSANGVSESDMKAAATKINARIK